MNKLIKNAIVYSAQLPAADALRQHFAEKRFTEPAQLDWFSAGFVPIPATGELVSTFEGGLAFAVRYDSKILPGTVIRAETDKRIAKIEADEFRKVGRKDRLQIKEMVTDELLAKALTKTAIVTCYYDPKNERLVVPVSSKQLADVVTRQLVHAVGSVKTTTINVSDVKLGLTTKVQQWLNDDSGDIQPFGEHLEPGGWVKMVGESESVTFDMAALDKAYAGIDDALGKDFQVSELEMTFQLSTTFRLTNDFRLKGIEFCYEPAEDAADKRELWELDASTQLLELSRIIDALCDLLSYKEPAQVEDLEA